MQVLYFAEKYLMASSTILDDGKEKELVHTSDTKEDRVELSMCENV